MQIVRALGRNEAPPVEIRTPTHSAIRPFGDSYGEVTVGVQSRMPHRPVGEHARRPRRAARNWFPPAIFASPPPTRRKRPSSVHLTVSGIVPRKLVPEKHHEDAFMNRRWILSATSLLVALAGCCLAGLLRQHWLEAQAHERAIFDRAAKARNRSPPPPIAPPGSVAREPIPRCRVAHVVRIGSQSERHLSIRPSQRRRLRRCPPSLPISARWRLGRTDRGSQRRRQHGAEELSRRRKDRAF